MSRGSLSCPHTFVDEKPWEEQAAAEGGAGCGGETQERETQTQISFPLNAFSSPINAFHKITNITQSERESRSKIGSGERPARNRKDVGFSLLFCLLCLPPCLNSRSGPIRGCFWSKGAVVWRLCAVKLVVLPVEVSFPGGGGSYSSVAAGPCLREVEAFSAPPSSVLSPEGEGSLSLASPVLGVSVRWIGFGSRLWLVCGSGFVVPSGSRICSVG
ncbi:hypothetical protein F2Q69_00046920 [Brassica cretica]|uniref:Uncharacterized protein n=1 Tax=Brassica cretica TaxID=69181 RepID=A0A8S9PUI7_BRACR|nr:hypothetical protein F2Q69_00046920 [Brassica cretica]